MRGATRLWLLAGATGLVVVVGAAAWWMSRPILPEAFASGNGRIEADDVAIAAKYASRVDSILVEEGDLVEPGQLLARMDSTELEARLREATAQAVKAVKQRDVAKANIAQREAECRLAESELRRSSRLFQMEIEPESEVDVKQSRYLTAQAACDAANAQLSDAEAAIEAANARVERIEAQISEGVLRAPARGRVLYRLAEPGEVVSAGGRVLTLLDLTDVYMEIFLPSRHATRVSLGAEARVVLDAVPDVVIPAFVSFVAPKAQFTPKQVETAREREKLMFRVKVRIPSELIEPRIEIVKTGVRGVAYVQLDGPEGAPWPEHLEARLPPNGSY